MEYPADGIIFCQSSALLLVNNKVSKNLDVTAVGDLQNL